MDIGRLFFQNKTEITVFKQSIFPPQEEYPLFGSNCFWKECLWIENKTISSEVLSKNIAARIMMQ